MQDRVKVEGLVVEGSVGVYDFEKSILQRMEIDVTAHLDLRPAGASDALDDALDYDRISATCRQVVASQHHQLIEAIADRIAARILDETPKVEAVDVRVSKPGAVPDARTVAVEVHRSRRSTSP